MTEEQIRADERERIARFVEEEYVRQFIRPWREDLVAAIRARGVKGTHVPRPMTVKRWPSLDALKLQDSPFTDPERLRCVDEGVDTGKK